LTADPPVTDAGDATAEAAGEPQSGDPMKEAQ